MGDTIPVSMATMVTNKPGPALPPALALAAAERGQLRPNPDMDSTVTILMVTMVSTVPTMVFTWELVSLVTPVPLLLIPTEVFKVLARGLLKKRLPLPRLKSHPLLKLLPYIMDFLSTDMVFPLFTTTPPSNGPVIRSPDLKELPGVPVERGPLMPNPVITDTPMVTTDTVPVTTFTEAPKALASKCNVAP